VRLRAVVKLRYGANLVVVLALVGGASASGLSAAGRMRFERGTELAAHHGQYQDALEDFRAVLAEQPDYAPAVVSAAQCHASLGNLSPARELYTRALGLGLATDSAVIVLRELGKLCMQLGAFEDAQGRLERARRLDGRDAEIAALLGDAYRKRGALSLDAHRRDAHVGLASAYLETGDQDAAVRHARAAVEIDPFYPDAWYIATRAFTKLGERDQARLALASYTRMRAYSSGVEAITQALGSDPGNIALVQALADRHAREGNLDRAVAAYERATGVDTARQAAYANIALLRLRQSDVEKAAAALRMASDSGDDHATLHFAYGEYHSAARDWPPRLGVLPGGPDSRPDDDAGLGRSHARGRDDRRALRC
jgi:tetratricopeptide (TPR) repeat protein